MIPKVIHYCWFGGNPLPEEAKKCIASWKKFLPDYVIKEWNESNFDVNAIPYTKEAYEAKKWAFVSDYVRFRVLYNYGGLYFDTDVEVIKPIDDIIARGNFMGYECPSEVGAAPRDVAPGLGLGVNPGLDLIKSILEEYDNNHFLVEGVPQTNKTVVNYTTEEFNKIGKSQYSDKVDYSEGVYLYYPEYFCPLNHHTGKLTITENTRTIHHYTATWKSSSQKRKAALIRILGPKMTDFLVKVKHCLQKPK